MKDLKTMVIVKFKRSGDLEWDEAYQVLKVTIPNISPQAMHLAAVRYIKLMVQDAVRRGKDSIKIGDEHVGFDVDSAGMVRG